MIATFLHIFTHVLLPFFLLVGCGFFLQRRFGYDINPLAKVNVYLFVPAFMFVQVIQSTLTIGQMLQVAGFVGALVALLWLWSQGVAWLRGYSSVRRRAFSLTQMFYNSGNFGLPVNYLAFEGNPFALTTQVIVLVTQNSLNFTIGLMLAAHNGSWREGWKALLRYPFLYALAVALVIRSAGWEVWPPLWRAVQYLANALIPVATVTLGSQLALVRLHRVSGDVLLACGGRLVLGPLMGLGLLTLLGWQGLLKQALLLSCGAPTAINTTLLTIEFNTDPEFASQVTFLSTLLSGLTVTLLLMGVQAMG